MKTTQINQQNSDSILYNVSHLKPVTKLWISILFGLTSLLLSPYGISAKMGEIIINIPWTILFPILASMAFGWRYGLIASLAGGAYFPFLLWPNNGWANLMTTTLFTAFFTSIGLINGMRITIGKPVLFYRIFIILILIIFALAIGDLFLFNQLLSLKPPFWYKNTLTHLDSSVLSAFLIKDSTNIVFFTLIGETLLCVPFMRRLFGLEVKSFMRLNTRIFSYVILASILLWGIYYGLDFVLLQAHRGLHDGHIPLTFFVLIVGGFTSARFIIYYTERQLLIKDLLAENQETLKLQFNRMPVACIVWGTDSSIKDWNPAAETIFGFNYAEVIGKTANETIVPQYVKPQIAQIWNTLLKEGLDKHSINENCTKDGRTILCEWTNTPLKDKQEKVIGIISMVKDITEGKKRDDALQFLANRGWCAASEEFFNSLAKYLGKLLELDYVLIGKLNEVSDTVETIALYAHGELIPNITYKLNGTPCNNVVGKEMCVYQKGIQAQFPLDKLLIDMQAESYLGMPLWDSKGKPIGIIAVLDTKPLSNIEIITSVFNIFAISAGAEIERQLSEDALRESEEKYRGLVDYSPDAIAIYVEGKIVYVNNECLRLMAAKSKSELIGKSVIQLVHPEYREFFTERMKKTATDDTVLPLVEDKFIRLDGSAVDVEVKALPMRFENKPAVQLIVRDITGRKLAEEWIKVSESNLQAIINRDESIWSIDTNYNLIICNDFFRNTYFKTYGIELLTDTNMIEVLTDELREFWKPKYDSALAGEKISFEFHQKFQGITNYYDVILTPIFFQGKVSGLSGLALNTTHRKLGEELLLQTKANLSAIIENTTDSIWAINTSYEILYINNVFMQAYFDSFGIRLMVGMNLLEAVPEPIRPIWKSRYDRAFKNEQFILEDKIDLGYTTIYIELLGNPIVTDGKVIGASFFSRDITERKQAEAALIQSEERFRLILENMPILLNAFDENGMITAWNKACEDATGYLATEIIGNPKAMEWLYPNEAYREKVITSSTDPSQEDGVYDLVSKDGQVKTIQWFDIYHKLKIPGWDSWGIGQDITERKQIELALKESEEKYRSTFYTSPDSVNINQMDGTYVDVNESFTKITGYTRADVIGKLSSEIEIWAFPEDRAKLVKGLRERGTVENMESIFRCKDGTLKTALMSARIIKINNTPHILSITRDITDRVQMELALKESEEKYRLTFYTSPDAVNINSMDGTFIDVNEGFTKMSGYTKQEVIGKLSSEVEIWVYREERHRMVNELKKLGEVNNFEALFVRKDGSLKTGLMSARIVNINNTPHILTITRDITERKALEVMLKKSEEQFRLLFERSNNAIFLIDKKDGTYLDANKAGEKLTGYSLADLKKLHTTQLAPEGAKSRLSKIANLKETIDIGEIEYINPDQSKKYATLSVVPLNENAVFGIANDITERKQFEAKLRILSRAIDQSPALVMITNNEGEIEYVNRKFIEVTQYSLEEVLGKNPRILKSGNASKKDYEKLWKTINAGKEWSGEFCNVKKNGEEYWESAVISPIFNEKGIITHFVALKEDITDRKETDRRILSTIIETEERERNRFSRDLHDGLGPLLSTIKLYFQWLSETDDLEKKKLITEKGDKNLNEAIESIREISNNLSPRTLTTFGVEAAIKNFIDNLNQTQKLAVTFQTNIQNRLDKNIEITIYRIVTELLNNTIKYANATKSEVKLLIDEKKEWITLTYTDDGNGFDLNKVQSNTKGFGLVNITQRINTFNGKINIISSIGNGIQATIELPLSKN